MKDTLISALRASGKILLEYYNKPVGIKQKESQSSIVTEADFASDSIIREMLGERFPEHNLITEESGFQYKESEYTWIIDPLDGTSNFASGIPWFGILISLFSHDEPVMGGAYLPVQDILYLAEKGKGASRNGTPLYLSREVNIHDSLIAFSLDYTDDDIFLNRGLEIFKYVVKSSRNIRSTNSLLDFLFVAEGKLGGCINLFTKIWDISAAGLIINEAGGKTCDIYGKELRFSLNDNILNQNFPVCMGSKIIVDSLSKVFRSL